MNSPPRGVPTATHTLREITDTFSRALKSGLETALSDQERATPEFDEHIENGTSAYQYLAKVERSHFKTSEAQRLRELIPDIEYWKEDVRIYAAAVESFRGNEPAMEGWRNLALGYRTLLLRLGISEQQVEQIRLSIENTRYWQLEAELFKMQSRLRENKLQERWRKQHERRKKQAAPQSLQIKQPSTREAAQECDQVSSRTRSKTRSGRATKRGPQDQRGR
ncbi:hypothetical protein NOR_08395 [Metarhizium rileyi]|uniref:Uncharacterized protein n=1 Tax=Metarhizium rileyi (strain RCEF 4871) TaxID=1649241 RepID=A0A166WEB7_METRR|nr:hypothetical protein NOR_08395 [Metarhizium rileyi RCEF 4871]